MSNTATLPAGTGHMALPFGTAREMLRGKTHHARYFGFGAAKRAADAFCCEACRTAMGISAVPAVSPVAAPVSDEFATFQI